MYFHNHLEVLQGMAWLGSPGRIQFKSMKGTSTLRWRTKLLIAKNKGLLLKMGALHQTTSSPAIKSSSPYLWSLMSSPYAYFHPYLAHWLLLAGREMHIVVMSGYGAIRPPIILIRPVIRLAEGKRSRDIRLPFWATTPHAVQMGILAKWQS